MLNFVHWFCSILNLPNPGVAVYKLCIELEVTSGDEGLLNARKLFECALATYKEDISLWQEYYSMEIKVSFLHKWTICLTCIKLVCKSG